MAIKINVGKLQVKKPFVDLPHFFTSNGLEWLPLTFEHNLAYLSLELLHRDPFDRMLIAQAMIEGLTIVTRDAHFEGYGVKVLW
jgi:PIN domain nuclease of toxin-antitoxin system